MRALVLACVLLAVPVSAQEVRPVPDWASYATASVNPAMAVWQAAHAIDPKCRFAQLAISSAIANGVGLTLKHFVASPRPCLGCAPDGFPSGHSWNSVTGLASASLGGLRLAVTMPLATAGLRVAARRHTWPQVGAGLLLGFGAEAAAHHLVQCSESAP